MYFQENIWMMEKIFHLSDKALIHMVNRLFRTEYSDEETILKEWNHQETVSVWLTIGCANRYMFQLRCLEGCIQIYAEDRGCMFQYGSPAKNMIVQMREPQIIYFGKNRKEEYCTTLEFPGHERITLPVHIITLSECSAEKLEASGLILFLPFLFHCFAEESAKTERKQEFLKYFMIHDIVGTLNLSLRKGDLTVFDVQRLKQFCRQMVWRMFAQESWMQDLELQELILDIFETDLDLLERVQRLELQRIQNKQVKI